MMNDPYIPSPHFMLIVYVPLAVLKNQLACSVSDDESQYCQAGGKNGETMRIYPRPPGEGALARETQGTGSAHGSVL